MASTPSPTSSAEEQSCRHSTTMPIPIPIPDGRKSALSQDATISSTQVHQRSSIPTWSPNSPSYPWSAVQQMQHQNSHMSLQGQRRATIAGTTSQFMHLPANLYGCSPQQSPPNAGFAAYQEPGMSMFPPNFSLNQAPRQKNAIASEPPQNADQLEQSQPTNSETPEPNKKFDMNFHRWLQSSDTNATGHSHHRSLDETNFHSRHSAEFVTCKHHHHRRASTAVQFAPPYDSYRARASSSVSSESSASTESTGSFAEAPEYTNLASNDESLDPQRPNSVFSPQGSGWYMKFEKRPRERRITGRFERPPSPTGERILQGEISF